MDGRDDVNVEQVGFVPCNTCEHAIGKGQIKICVAFPDGIPEEIRYGRNGHTAPLPEQENDIVYEKKE